MHRHTELRFLIPVIALLALLFLLASCSSGDSTTDGDESDGDTTDGDTTDGDTSDGDEPDGDVTDGDTTDGDEPDGDTTDGDEPDGDVTDGDTTDGDEPDGDVIDGDEDGDIDGDEDSADTHPYWPAEWSTFIPAENEYATYQMIVDDVTTDELKAVYERDVEWQGETWDRIALKYPDTGDVSMTVYLREVSPWVVEVKGSESFLTTEYALSEVFDTPLTFDLATELDQTETYTGTVRVGSSDPLDVTYSVTTSDYDATVTVPYGELTGCAVYDITVSGSFMGDFDLDLQIVAHPEQRIVKWTDPPGGRSAELLSAWTTEAR